MPGGRPRLMNQKLVNQMVALRRQGFSHREIADKVERSERTVRRYTRGVTPRLELPRQHEPVDVLSDCVQSILRGRTRLGLDTRETDEMIKALRRTLEPMDPLTIDWLASDRQARRDFLLEFLRNVLPHINDLHHVRRIQAEIGTFVPL